MLDLRTYGDPRKNTEIQMDLFDMNVRCENICIFIFLQIAFSYKDESF